MTSGRSRSMTQPDSTAHQLDTLIRLRKDALTLRWVVATVLVGVHVGFLASFAETISGAKIKPVLVTALALLAAAFAAASIIVPRALLDDDILNERLRLPIDAPRWAKRMRLKALQTHVFVALPAQAQRLVGLTLLFERPYTLGLVFAAGVGFLGLAYGMLTRSLFDAAPFFLAALALNCWHYPRLSRLIERGRRLLKADQHASPVTRKPLGPRLRRGAPRPQGPVKS